MKEIIEDLRILLKDGIFKDEQHVRFSLVGRICHAYDGISVPAVIAIGQ